MLQLSQSLAAWNTPQFAAVLKAEIERLDGDLLPLQQGLSRSSYAITTGFQVLVLDVCTRAESISVRAGISYQGIIAGCSCADDPTPVDTLPEYCEVQLEIDMRTASTTVTLLED